jgi:hypothetical protein
MTTTMDGMADVIGKNGRFQPASSHSHTSGGVRAAPPPPPTLTPPEV